MKSILFKRCGALAATASLLFALPSARAENSKTSCEMPRIHFARGHESRTVTLTLTQKRPRVTYLVRTRAGQRMGIKVTSLAGNDGVVPTLNVISPSGAQSQAQHTKARRFDTMKTQAGDYRVEVGTNLMASNGTRGECRLKIWIR